MKAKMQPSATHSARRREEEETESDEVLELDSR